MPPRDPTPLLALVGPTASGKTAASLDLAERFGAEIVSVDSMLVYRGMDVGTAKPTPAERARVPHHLLDLADPAEPFSVARYQSAAREALAGIAARGHGALLVGGSGLYFRAVVDALDLPPTDPATRTVLQAEAAAVGPERLHRRLAGLDPEAAGRIEPANVRRTVRALEVAALTGRRFSSFAEGWERYPGEGVRAAGVEMDPSVIGKRIERRVHEMLSRGFLEEVRGLVGRGLGAFLTAGQAIGYAEMVEHLSGSVSLEEAVARTVKRTRTLARRQMAWFRRDPRIRWFRVGPEGAGAHVRAFEEHLRGG
ncbi:MAG: tRNA (adenosine(37)-N6)-dimethylallyltransferase MiaA [Actinobacteria bacterium]|nr:tRNA (adenosine(37)-N6)-dimethylallyltransferase MiaA [Actinomycetota bacterium]